MPDAAVSPAITAVRWSERHWVLASALVCALLTVLLHYPGQISLDAVLQLYDGQTGRYQSNQPPAVSFLLSRLTPGGFLLLQVALYTAAVLLLVEHSRAALRWRLIAVVLLFVYPVPLVYNGILWKDVFYANLVLLGFMALAAAGSRRRGWLLLSGALLGLACLIRQQGMVAAAVAVPALLSLPPRGRGWRGRLQDLTAWSATGLAVPAVVTALVATTAVSQDDLSFRGGFYQIMTFDLAGISARAPDAVFPQLIEEGVDPAVLRRKFGQYRPDRVDWLAIAAAEEPLHGLGNDVLFEAWREAVSDHPIAYLSHRLDAFAWLLGLHDVRKCSPTHTGIVGDPPAMVQALGLEPGKSDRAELIAETAGDVVILYKPLPYVLLGLAAAFSLWWRDRARHVTMLWLQAAGLVYLASYLLIGIACDFRYGYFPVMAAMFTVVHAVLGFAALRRRGFESY